jgi:hypothetical protein
MTSNPAGAAALVANTDSVPARKRDRDCKTSVWMEIHASFVLLRAYNQFSAPEFRFNARQSAQVTRLVILTPFQPKFEWEYKSFNHYLQ